MTSAYLRQWGLAFSLLALLLSTVQADEAHHVVSQHIVSLQADGRSFVLNRTLLSDWNSYDFHVDKGVGEQDFLYVYPGDYQWDDQSSETTNILRFPQGNFVVMYPGRFDKEVTMDDQGVYTFRNDDTPEADGHFGFWNTPGNFDSFVYAWIFPAHFEILDYKANRPGNWVKRNNAITYYGKDVNDLVFTIRYRQKDSDGDGVVDRQDRCPDTPEGTKVDVNGCEPDSDGDGVSDRIDACPNTRVTLPINARGCWLDTDGDGVVDPLDQCPKTPAGAKVDAKGCELDSDGDGVADSADQCPGTPAGAKVDAKGCELDSDGDGVVDSADQCPETPAGAKVDAKGCELDIDGDGVVDSLDQCPETPAGAKVDAKGCELDSDGDGVVDSADQCPETPAGAKVDAKGCELDSDGDGVADSADQCPETPAGAKVDAKGCQLDGDDDGVTDAQDLCPNTKPGVKVDATGCNVAAAIELQGVHFHTGSAELTEESLGILDRVADTLKQVPGIRLEVAGHTDDQGDTEFNRRLSQQRAETVRDYLISRDIPAQNLTAKGYGEDRPVADNTSPEGRAKNRRVELKRLDK